MRCREELFGLIPMEGHTTGEVMFQKIVAFFNKRELDLQKVCLLVTGYLVTRADSEAITVAPGCLFVHFVFSTRTG